MDTVQQPTGTQMEMLALCAQGRSREDIGSQLFLSPWTVKRYLDDLRELLGAKNVTHAVALCIATGYLRIDPITNEIIAVDAAAGLAQVA